MVQVLLSIFCCVTFFILWVGSILLYIHLFYGIVHFSPFLLRTQYLVIFVSVTQVGLVSPAQKISMSVPATPVGMGELVLMALMLSVVNAQVPGLDLSVRFPSKVWSPFLILQVLTA